MPFMYLFQMTFDQPADGLRDSLSVKRVNFRLNGF